MQKIKLKILKSLTILSSLILTFKHTTFAASGDEAKSSILPFAKNEILSWSWLVTLAGALFTIAGIFQFVKGRNKNLLYIGIIILFLGSTLVSIILGFVK